MARLGRSQPFRPKIVRPDLGPVYFDNNSSSGLQAAQTTYNWTHKVGTNSNRGILVAVSIFASASPSVSSISVGGLALTLVRRETRTLGAVEIWKGVAPSTGDNTVTVTMSEISTSVADAASYWNVNQTDFVDAQNGASGTNTPASASVTPVSNNVRIFGALSASSTSGITNADGQANRYSVADASGSAFFAEKGVILTPASTALQWNGLGALDKWAVVLVSIRRAATKVPTTKSLTYLATAKVSITKSLIYAVSVEHVVTRSLTYATTTEAAITKSLKYCATAEMPVTKSLRYAVAAEASLTKSLTYNVAYEQAVTKSLTYLAVAEVVVTKSLTYDVTSDHALTKSLTYATSVDHALTKSLVYCATAAHPVTKSLQYEVTAEAAITKSLTYETVSEQAVTKSLSYSVVTVSSETLSLTYEVSESTSTVAITKSLTYAVYGEAAVTKSLAYSVVVKAPITKSLTYYAVAEAPMTKSLKYCVVTHPATCDYTELSSNGGFETQPSYTADTSTSGKWIDGTVGGSNLDTYKWYFSKSGSDVHARFATDDTYAGSGSLKAVIGSNASYFEIRGDSTGYFGARGIALTPGVRYRAYAAMKSENVTGDSASGQHVQFLCSKADGSSASQEFTVTSTIKINQAWTLYSVDFTAGPNSYWGHFECRCYGHNGTATLQGTFRFDAISLIVLTNKKSLRYLAVKGRSITKSLTYRAVTEAAVTKSLAYCAVSEQVVTKSLQYLATAKKSVTKSLTYLAVQEGAITRSLSYSVTAEAAVTKSLTYVVALEVAVTLSLTYSLAHRITLTKSLTYDLAEIVVLTKALVYKIASQRAATKSLTYAVLNDPYRRDGSGYSKGGDRYHRSGGYSKGTNYYRRRDDYRPL